MADLNAGADLPNARRVPEKIAERLTDEEMRHRCEYAWNLEQRTPGSGEARNLMLNHATAILRALPVREAVEHYNDLHHLASRMPNSGLDSPAADLRSAAAQIKEDNKYPPDLWNCAVKRLNGVSNVYYDGADLNAILDLTPEVPDTHWTEPGTQKSLSHRIDAYQRALYRQYKARGMKPPFDLEDN